MPASALRAGGNSPLTSKFPEERATRDCSVGVYAQDDLLRSLCSPETGSSAVWNVPASIPVTSLMNGDMSSFQVSQESSSIGCWQTPCLSRSQREVSSGL